MTQIKRLKDAGMKNCRHVKMQIYEGIFKQENRMKGGLDNR